MALRRRFVPPVQAVKGGWKINLDVEERNLLLRLVGELEALLSGDQDHELLARLYPVAYPDDEEKEAEYQRLMREELMASRLGSIEAVKAALDPERDEVMDEGETIALLQSINTIRLVLGTMLGITDDESADAADEADTPEHHLYDFLSWLLEWTVRSLSPD